MDGSGEKARAYLFAGFRLDPESRTLTRDGVPAPVTPMVFATLLHLVRHAGEVVTKDELVQAVWAGRAVGDSTITQTIHSLRQALAAAGSRARLISTISGHGYRFIGEVRAEGPSPPPPPEPREPPAPERTRRWRPAVLAAAGGIVALAAAAVALVALNPRGPPPWRHSAVTGPPTVLVQAPFQNLTAEHGFDRALGRVVEVDLGQSPRLRVLTDRQVADTLAQMARSPDAALDARLAGQVCLRNNGQAVVEGALAPVGARFLVTLTATACADGALLSAEKRLVDRREDIVPALDQLIDRTRRDLGEPAEGVRRFDTPLLRGQTGSLAALEAYSEGVRASAQGNLPDAIALQQHAVDLDPSFADAYLELTRSLFNSGRYVEARAAITRAFALRGNANEELRYSIEILYHLIVDLDYRRAQALAKAATDIFPGHLIGWGQQANLDIQFGRYDDAALEARREVDLDPSREGAYSRLAEALRSAGRFDEAAQVCRDAAAHHAAAGMIDGQLAFLALARGDRPAMEAIAARARGRPWEPDLVVLEAEYAFALGELRRGAALFQQARGLYAAAGEDGSFIGHEALGLVLAGEPAAGLRVLPASPPRGPEIDLSKVDIIYALSETGQAPRARALLREFLTQEPLDTTLNTIFAPAARAALDLAQDRPKDALGDLAPAGAYEARDNAVPYLRGRIDLALGDGEGAAAAFHRITDHPGVDPSDIRHSLAWLGLARAERLRGHPADSRTDYLKFLALWRNADPDVPVLIQARAELARLS